MLMDDELFELLDSVAIKNGNNLKHYIESVVNNEQKNQKRHRSIVYMKYI
jgi:hypothetical protein